MLKKKGRGGGEKKNNTVEEKKKENAKPQGGLERTGLPHWMPDHTNTDSRANK